MDDLADVISAYLVRYSSCIAAGVTLMLFLADSDDLSGPGLIAAAGVLVGTVIGVLVGSLLTIAIHIVHVVVAVVTATVALISWGVLRSLDIICRLVAGVLMPCPDCHGTVKPYPTYVCPRCSERHHDIRPGSCGIAVRNCTCTARFPTSLLTGAGRLEAECPTCGSSLPARFGVMPEILIPVFGSLNVGKTQLMYTLTRAFDSIVTSNGTLVFEGDTPERLDRIKEDLVSKGRPDKTLPNTPSAYLMRIKVRLSERRIFIFDPAGELHYSIDGVNELNYLNKAKVFVYVIDPLASETLWAAISEENRGKLRDIRSSKSESELAYHHTREQMRRLGAKTQYARLAIVLSKADIVENVGIKLTASSADERKTLRDWVKDDLGMGNVVREAQHSFAQVEFFQTAALTSDADEPDESVEVLARWLLRSQGVNLKEAVTYRA